MRASRPLPRFRVATYNINCGNYNLAAVLDAVREADADLVCLQEANAESVAALKSEFGARYPHIGFHGSVVPYGAGGFAILSRLSVTDERFVPPRHGLFGACVLEVQHGAHPIQLICVHLQPLLLSDASGDGNPFSMLSAFKAAEQTHLDEMKAILEHVRTDIPALIVGDFNSGSEFQAPALLRERGFVDSFASVNENPEAHPTWRLRARFGELSLRIDYIFHSETLRTIESRVVRTDGSDHSLLLSTLELTPTEVDSNGAIQ